MGGITYPLIFAEIDLMLFDEATLKFLKQLKRNNNRDWFNRNKERYETEVRAPALHFIQSLDPKLKKISPHFLAVPKKVGGSLMRIYRDTRFSKDKTPYKTNVGIHFRHEFGKDVHTPGYYLHISPEEIFLGLGIWHPDSTAIKKIRTAIDAEPQKWNRAKKNKTFSRHFELAGEQLKKAPLGFEKDHPLIEDIKRKDFIGVCKLTKEQLFSRSFEKLVIDKFKSGSALMRFLCDALIVPF